MRTIGTVSASLTVTALLATACAASDAPAERPPAPPTAPVTVAATCPAPTRSHPPRSGYDPGPAGNVPADFGAVAALRCTALPTGITGPVTVQEDRLDGELDGLLTALATPWASERADVCPLDHRVNPYLVLLAADGTAIRPAVPLDGCGQPRREVIDAIDALPWRAVPVPAR
ncbi:hypothetical protein BDK92_7665 [Micromonospora pisi]|uniref:Subtilisin inhibitor-like n=1 Tax=Micromonospora pisi TaxID=589240 RepID=A0A495JVZ7_9ACTN|nr:hypothetical protein [Micromonospora pisi]RKR93147.1 hypothetical protein BDK92_7665 [Micromonospora pisi]